MLTVDNVTDYLLDRRLIDATWIIDGPLTIRSLPRRNRNLVIVGPGTTGFLIKQPYDQAEGGRETLRREALFHGLCREEPEAALMAEVLPHLLDRDLEAAILVFELIPGVVTLLSQFEDPSGREVLVDAAYGFGQALGTFHRVFRAIELDDSRLSWLPREIPSAMEPHRPKAARRATLSGAVCELLRVFQKTEVVGVFLDGLRGLWRPETVIHADIKFDNVLVRTPSAPPGSDEIEVWIADWELVQVGDPAWDLAGALQDLLSAWVCTMPLNESLDVEAMTARARLPLAGVRGVAQALWAGYRDEAVLDPAKADDLLLRAVKFSAARLLQNACEWSWYEDRVPTVAAILLEVAENLLTEPEQGQVLLYGITPGTAPIMSLRTIHEDLLAVVDAVEILSSARYTLLGKPREIPDESLPEVGSPRLVSVLAEHLYGRLFTRPSRPFAMPRGDLLARRDHIARLSEANTGQGTWEPGWRFQRIDPDGRFVVARDDIAFWAPATAVRLTDNPSTAGERCRLQVAKELRNSVAGFYVAIGDAEQAEDCGGVTEPMVCYYWHLTAAAAVPFLATATSLLNATQVPFRIEVLDDPHAYHRADAGILFLRLADNAVVRSIIAAIHSSVASGLRPGVPMFTKRLADGLGFAMSPPGSSGFGQHGCLLAAEALWRSFLRGETDREAHVSTLAARFREEGIDPLRPYLGTGNGADDVMLATDVVNVPHSLSPLERLTLASGTPEEPPRTPPS